MFHRGKFLRFGLVLKIGIALLIGGLVAQFGVPLPVRAPDRSVVYLVDPAQADSLVAPSRLQTTLNTRTAATWDAFLQIEQAAGVDALIIHESALPTVDQAWVQTAYHRGVVLAGFNITGAQMATLVGDPCIAEGDFAAHLPNYIVVALHVSGDNPNEAERAMQHRFQDCAGERPLQDITGSVSIGGRRSQDTLAAEEDFNNFLRLFATYFLD
jgi:hypothetical protein